MWKRVGLLGDIHGEDDALALAISQLQCESIDALLSVGDVVDGEGDVDRCLSLLQARRAMVVRGNHERWLLANSARSLPFATPRESLSERALAQVSAWPATLVSETASGEALLCHGLYDNDMNAIYPDTAERDARAMTPFQRLRAAHPELRYMLSGHTHHRMVRVIDGVTLINAGTLVERDTACFSVVDFEQRVARFFDIYDRKTLFESERYAL